MLHNKRALTILAGSMFASIVALTGFAGQASALTGEACEQVGGIVGLIPATVTQQPSPSDINRIGKAQCRCHHADPAIDQQPVWGLVYLGMPANSPFASGFYQCEM